MIRLKLKEVLQEKGISKSKLSRMADVSLNTIQVMYHNPNHDAVLRIDSIPVRKGRSLETNMFPLTMAPTGIESNVERGLVSWIEEREAAMRTQVH